jgi:hypothetical protein
MLRSGLCQALLMLTVGAATNLATSNGQDMVLSQMYGSGVHAYFSGNFRQAMADLTTVIDSGSTDPRAFYFRGLAAMRMGGNANAAQDFARGSQLEAKALDRFYPVSRSLERVQGNDRVALERHRALARAAAYQEKQKKAQVRYEQLRRAEAAVLRATPAAEALPVEKPAPPPVPVEDVAPADDPFAKEPEKPAEEDPFAEGDKPTEEMPADDTKEPVAEAEEDPFAAGGDESQDAEKPAADEDPFTDEKEAPKEEGTPKADDKKPDDKADNEEESPFGN